MNDFAAAKSMWGFRKHPFLEKKKTEVCLIYSVVSVSGIQQSDSVIYMYMYIYIFHILFHYSLLQDRV